MMLDWNDYHKEIGSRLGELMKLSPDTLRGYRTLSDANAKTSHLGAKTRELISLAVAVTTHCDGCIVVHTDAALKAGATREEISEALGVAVAMNAGAALIYSTRVLDAVEAKKSAGPAFLTQDRILRAAEGPALLRILRCSHARAFKRTPNLDTITATTTHKAHA